MLFSLIKKIKERIQDIKTICKLSSGAKEYANLNGEENPGAEHFMLSALDLPDGTAKNVFNHLNLDTSKINHAIKKQHKDALSSIGVDYDSIKVELESPEKVKMNSILYKAQPSGEALMQKVFKINKERNIPLLGVHVIEVIASMEYGIAARTLRAMGVDSAALNHAVETELQKT